MPAAVKMTNAYSLFSDCVPTKAAERLGFDVPVYNWTPFNPKIQTPRSGFAFNVTTLRQILLAVSGNINIVIVGPPGCGKVTAIQEIAARLGRPFHRFSVNDIDRTELALAAALDEPSIINLDDIENIDPIAQYATNRICETTLKGDHAIVATATTSAETIDCERIKNRMPESTRDRFSIWIDFLSPELI